MFRSISKSVRKREGELVQKVQSNQTLNDLIGKFLIEIFGPVASQVKIEASLEGRVLTIGADNKIAANEILFQSGRLCRFLQQHQIVCNRIIIR
ncbi:MAG TPA: hypothetical protein VFK07_03175 [Candidatus Paceibacterota bacterium]|nr:hypothetical protein [Candidatus Paceibacterota bacterium]